MVLGPEPSLMARRALFWDWPGHLAVNLGKLPDSSWPLVMLVKGGPQRRLPKVLCPQFGPQFP